MADINFEMADHMRTKPDIDSLTLEGVSLTLKDVNLTLPSQHRSESVFQSIEQRLSNLNLMVANISEVASCLTDDN